MAKKKSISSKDYALVGFGGVLGGIAAMSLLGLICITLFGIGYYFIVTYNKPGTKLLKEIQPLQYLGIFLCLLACLPFIQYFFLGFLASSGEAVFSNMFE